MNVSDISSALGAIQRRIATLNSAVKLLAVSKKQSVAKIQVAIQAGQRAFGESYLQEALGKIAMLEAENLEWHFIGHVQSNKTAAIAAHFDWVQSVDRVKIADRLSFQRPAHLAPLNVCIEVNVDNEAGKTGCQLAEVPGLARHVAVLPHLRLRGLMAIPLQGNPTSSFERLKACFDALNQQGFSLDTLSMGMSGDFEAAVRHGSTLVRVGSAIFGARVT